MSDTKKKYQQPKRKQS